MGRIERQKRLLMEEANKSLLGEQEDITNKEYSFIDGNGNQYNGKVVKHYGRGVGVNLVVPEEIAQKLTDKKYENGSIAVDLSPDNGVLVNNMAFNALFGGGLKNDEVIKSFQ